ncbi:MAG: PQQ-binding-like beta-propeller repeat protein [Planctomycetota bacterium]|nr:PQQ-binding-like beta-propeller repeat protein [Planctomycetota bacterium]
MQSTRIFSFAIALVFSAIALTLLAEKDAGRNEQLISAAREGKLDAVKTLLAEGADIDHQGRFKITALWQASLKGHKEIALYLIDQGANPNVNDTVWQVTPLMVSQDPELVKALLEAGADADRQLRSAAYRGDKQRVELLLSAGSWNPRQLAIAHGHAGLGKQQELQLLLEEHAGRELPVLKSPARRQLEMLTGSFQNTVRSEITVELKEGELLVRIHGGAAIHPLLLSGELCEWGDNRMEFSIKNGSAVSVRWTRGLDKRDYTRKQESEPAEIADSDRENPALDLDVAARESWPSFHGPQARGIAADQDLPEKWNLDDGTGIQWKVPVAGLANASPVIWKDRVFIATAVSGAGDDSLKIGLYGNLDAVDDMSEHQWQLICLSSGSGEVLWKRDLAKGIPSIKRHTKSSQANSTPATNGRQVVTVLSTGMICCHDMDGTLLWKTDLGVLDAGAFNDPEYQWGYGSSPVIHGDRVFVQCDLQKNSYLAAFALADGSQIWRVDRDEAPSWGSPTIYDGPEGRQLLTTGSGYARAYDPLTGNEIWRLGGHSAITVPTPFVAQGLAFLVDGYRPFQPIYAVRLSARGDISLKTGQTSNEHVAWSYDRGGSYLPSPLVYRGFLYICSNSGILGCYQAETGRLVYRKRFARGGDNSFTGCPVVADGRLYMTAETGMTYVVRTGPEFELLEMNPLGEYVLSTPAIAGGRILFRTHRHVIAVGR